MAGLTVSSLLVRRRSKWPVLPAADTGVPFRRLIPNTLAISSSRERINKSREPKLPKILTPLGEIKAKGLGRQFVEILAKLFEDLLINQ